MTNMRSLSCWRQRSRWYELGAISSTVDNAVAMNAAKKTSRPLWLSLGKPFANGTANRNAKSTCTPGSATRSSLRSSISSRLWRCSELSGTTELFQPGVARETADLLDAAIDGLDNARPRHADSTGAVRQSVLPLLLTVFRIHLDSRFAERLARQDRHIEPELLDLVLLIEMVCEEVARNPNVLVAEVPVRLQETNKELNHLR